MRVSVPSEFAETEHFNIGSDLIHLSCLGKNCAETAPIQDDAMGDGTSYRGTLCCTAPFPSAPFLAASFDGAVSPCRYYQKPTHRAPQGSAVPVRITELRDHPGRLQVLPR